MEQRGPERPGTHAIATGDAVRTPVAELRSGWLWNLTSARSTRLVFASGVIRMTSAGGRADAAVGAIDTITMRRSWRGAKLTLRTTDGIEHEVGGLDSTMAQRFIAQVTAQAVLQARALRPELLQVEGSTRELLNGSGPLRYSEHQANAEQLARIVGHCAGQLVRTALPPDAAAALALLAPLSVAGGFARGVDEANDRYAEGRLGDAQSQARRVLGRELTDEQALAVATPGDVTLVLAGAGSGKTAVIIARIAHLVRNEGADPAQLLVLAFNRDAARAIHERLPRDLAGVEVQTFHAFAYRVTARADGEAPDVSRLATDRRAYAQAISSILGEMLDDRDWSGAITEFVAYHGAGWRTPFVFRNPGEYYAWVRTCELRTFSGDLVKSYEELTIANFLTLHGVRFEYEAAYAVRTASVDYRQYRPDFHLPDQGIYIEHFALNEQGQAPPGWRGYTDGVAWKRSIHAENETQLIESYSWEHGRGVLLDRLRQRLAAAGVHFVPIPEGEAVRRLAKTQISALAQLLGMALHHVATSGAPDTVRRGRLHDRASSERARRFMAILGEVRSRYLRRLRDAGEVDFHDLIARATDVLARGEQQGHYRHVLVDEFQDISRDRMRLLEALNGDPGGVSFFLVGDDWQSIYRFAGSDVGLVRRCGTLLGHVRERVLGQTFRYGPDILRATSSFVQSNPEQISRPLRSALSESSGITVVAASDPAQGLRRALTDIVAARAKRGRSTGEVMVLGRYRHSRTLLPRHAPGNLRLRFATVHAAKGLEADDVVVLDLVDRQLGFPAQIEDDPLLALLTAGQQAGYAHAEERRLLYVAMTRARQGVWLLADASRPSVFVTELVKRHGVGRVLGQLESVEAPPCRRCRGGHLIATSGGGMACSNRPLCRYRPPRCPSCRRGVALEREGRLRCSNGSCTAGLEGCPGCGIGVLTLRRARRGSFYGCSEYASEQPCTYTASLTSDGRRRASGRARRRSQKA